MLASALYRMTRPPLVWGGLAMLVGYLASLLRRRPRYEDPAFRHHLRKYHRLCLLFGKRKAVQLVNERQAGLWAQRESVASCEARSSIEPQY